MNTNGLSIQANKNLSLAHNSLKRSLTIVAHANGSATISLPYILRLTIPISANDLSIFLSLTIDSVEE
ncbi:hypothetical protein EG703_05320 [Salmonella enterica]|nr:hypothetical protein [Salmonella enterica]